MKRTLSILLPGLLAVPFAAVPAEAAGEFWKTQRVTSSAYFDAVESFGRGNTWFYRTQYDSRPVTLWRWNGTRLVRTTMPASFKGGVIDLDFTSRTNGWALGIGTTTSESARKVTVLRWNGKAWRIARTGKVDGHHDVPQIKAMRGGGAVVTGLLKGRQDKPLEWRFTGGKWKAATARTSFLRLSGDHAVGLFGNGEGLARWNGTTWKRVKVGALPALGPDDFTLLRDLDAPSAKDIWILADVVRPGTAGSVHILHGNGARWKRAKVPLPRDGVILDIASDGKGGVWITADAANTMETAGTETLLLHRLPSGTWRRTSTKVLAYGLARVPGTTSLWAVGTRLPDTRGFFTRGAE